MFAVSYLGSQNKKRISVIRRCKYKVKHIIKKNNTNINTHIKILSFYIFIFLLFLSTNLFGNTILKDSVLAERQQAGMTSTFSQSDDETVWIESHPVRRVSPKFEFGACFGVDLIPNNFDEFQTTLNSYNTELLNGFSGPLFLVVSGNYKHYTLGLQFGSTYTGESSYDSLKIKLNMLNQKEKSTVQKKF